MNSGRIGNFLDTGQFGGSNLEFWFCGVCDYGVTRIRAYGAVPQLQRHYVTCSEKDQAT